MRTVVGVDRSSGAIALDDRVPLGSTVRFCLRNAGSAHDELARLLRGRQAAGALAFVCNGRGSRLFDTVDNDAATVERTLGPVPVGGMFSAGEFGPVGGRSFVLTNSASLVLMHDRGPGRRRLGAWQGPIGLPTMTDRRTTQPDRVDEGDLEQLAINVIRGIAIDAPRAANSGHPGTAMALAPLAHVLFTRVMRHSPTEPGVARPRPVRAVQRARLDPALHHALPDRVRPHPRRPASLPQLGQPHAGPPRAQACARHRSHHRAARPGLRQQRRHGHRRAVAAGQLLARGLRPPHLRVRRRRVLRRGHLPRGRLAGRASGPRPARLRLRQQPHQHRRPDRVGLHRRRGRAVPGLRLVGGGRRARSPTTPPPSRRRWSGPKPKRTSRASSCCAATSATRHRT